MKVLSIIPRWIQNKYVLTAIGFATWLLFFDDRDILTNMKHRAELKRLERSQAYYQGQVDSTKYELEQLKNDPAILEKYAREKFRMKRDDEDLFIITN